MKLSSQCLIALTLIVLAQYSIVANASSYNTDDEILPSELEEMIRRDPSYVLGMLSKIRARFLKPVENTKRGIDFGLGRGYSGNQAAKHFMGLVASQYAGGPGKRKRSDPTLNYLQHY